tara:strand:- start:60 stop:1247 length:1188 start_codon:yes stop_codon:yes gene_type:complete
MVEVANMLNQTNKLQTNSLTQHSLLVASWLMLVFLITLFNSAAAQDDSDGTTVLDYVQPVPRVDGGLPLCWVPGGPVCVASYAPRERDASAEQMRQVSVDGFWIGKFEVRYREFEAWAVDMLSESDSVAKRLAGLNGQHGLQHFLLDTRPQVQNYPATGMNQWSAKRYCHWLSLRTGKFYRLPTEAEWERACRGGQAGCSLFPWGDDEERLHEFAVIGTGAEGERCGMVGRRQPNSLGIHDMLGNVEEWVADAFHESCLNRQDKAGLATWQNPIVWPASSSGWETSPAIWQLMQSRQQQFLDAFGAAKGGSGIAGRPRNYRAFSVAARTDPTSYDEADAEFALQDVPRSMSHVLESAIGFRVARPASIPDRHIQLWHWGIYVNEDEWLDTTLEPK